MATAAESTAIRILAIGPRCCWAGPLKQYQAAGRIHVEVVADLHQAAACLAAATGRRPEKCVNDMPRYRAMLVDPDYLSRREIAMLCIFKRHVNLPLWSLPSARNPKEMLAGQGILPWEEALQALAQALHSRFTPQNLEGSSRNLQTIAGRTAAEKSHLSDNGPRDAAEKTTEMPVATEVAARYDALSGPAQLSEQELRALLGQPEP